MRDRWLEERSKAIAEGKFEIASMPIGELAEKARDYKKRMISDLRKQAKVQRSNLQRKLSLIEEEDDEEFWMKFEKKVQQKIPEEKRKSIKKYWLREKAQIP